MKKISQLCMGYYYKADSGTGLYPNGSVNCEPPAQIELGKAYKYDSKKNCWLVVDDPKGLHVPLIDFNELPQKKFEYFNDELRLPIKRTFTLVPIRFLGFNSYYEIVGEKSITIRNKLEISAVQNRLAQLVDNATFLIDQLYAADPYTRNNPIPLKDWPQVHYSVKFNMEQAVYCMKLCFDGLIQLADFTIKQEKDQIDGCITFDSLGGYISEKREKKKLIKNKIFSQFKEEHDSFLEILNDIGNCYKHSFLQGIAEQLHGENEPIVVTVYAKKNKLVVSEKDTLEGVIIYCIPFRQIVLGFFSTLEATMNSIKAGLPEEVLPIMNKREALAKQTGLF